MKLAIQLESSVVGMAIAQVAKAFGHEVVDVADEADVVIADDMRQMLSHLKRGRRVVQYITHPSIEPATGLMTSYPEQFKSFRVVEGKGVGGSEDMIGYLLALTHEEKKNEATENPGS